jgi:two-component system chemotaxis sensor kinase CheA
MAKEVKAYLNAFISEADELLQGLNQSLLQLENTPGDMGIINQLFRTAHTLKSSAAFMGFKKMSALAHTIEDSLGVVRNEGRKTDRCMLDVLFASFDAIEDMLEQLRTGRDEDIDIQPLVTSLQNVTTGSGDVAKLYGQGVAARPPKIMAQRYLKIDSKRLDTMVDLVGELLINKMRLEQLAAQHKIATVEQAVSQLSRLVDDIQYEIMQARMVPVSHVFDRFPRLVRDLAKLEGKDIRLVSKGGDIELDRTVLDLLGEPLIHLIRNAVDHGVEPPDGRVKAGKPEKGTITLSAKREKNMVIVELADDGAGFDVEGICKKVINEGLLSEEQVSLMTRDQLMQLTFNPSFSTADRVTDVSGRGVGLDVVKTMIQNINGALRLESEEGKGTTFRLELPLTLAIIKCFLIEVSDETFAIPITHVERYLRLPNMKSIEGEEVFLYQENAVPLIKIADAFRLPRKNSDNPVVIIVERGKDKAGLLVDRIIGEQEIIMKPLTRVVNTMGFAGATILGDGSVALILDVNTLLEGKITEGTREVGIDANQC